MTEITIDPERYANIELQSGSHGSADEGMCLMEAVAHLAGERHTDYPLCVSSFLAEFGRTLNDSLPPDRRQELKPLIPSLIGTAADGRDARRAHMAADWLVRVWLPALADNFPDLQGCAEALRSVAPVVDSVTAAHARVCVGHQVSMMHAAATDKFCHSRAESFRECGSSPVKFALMHCPTARVAVDADVIIKLGAGLASATKDMATLDETVRLLQTSVIELYADMIKTPTH